MPVALLYRWKNAERANGWVLRARGLCNLLEQTMQRMWSSKALDAAEQEVANHADPGELDWGTRHKAKAAQTLRYLANDKNMVSTIQAQVGAKPLQRFLNRTFAADKLVTELGELEDIKAERPEAQGHTRKTFERNVRF